MSFYGRVTPPTVLTMKFLIFVTLFWQTSASPSDESGGEYVRLNNVTLPLKSFLHEYCVNDSDAGFQWCNESIPSFRCDTTTTGNQKCLVWCIGEGDSCTDLEECCGNEFECISQICRSANSRLDFVFIVKLALVTALVVTIFAAFTLCWKGIVEPRCIGYNTQAIDDNISITSERCMRSHSPLNYNFHPEKPPPYEECVQESCSAWSSQEPPPYAIAVNVTQDPPPDLPTRYFLACSSGLSELNVQDIKLQEVTLDNVREIIISSPINNMEDFVFYSTELEQNNTSNVPNAEESRPPAAAASPKLEQE